MYAAQVLAHLDGALTPVRLLAARFDGADAVLTPTSGIFRLSHRPQIAPEAYALTLFAGLSEELLGRYEQLHSITVPNSYRQILTRLNGAWLFEMSLFGVPASMARDPPRLDRQSVQPLDIGTANKHWRRRYPASSEHFFFGSGPYSDQERVAFFVESDNRITAILKNGHIKGSWSSWMQFFEDELARAEGAFPRFEHAMARKNS